MMLKTYVFGFSLLSLCGGRCGVAVAGGGSVSVAGDGCGALTLHRLSRLLGAPLHLNLHLDLL